MKVKRKEDVIQVLSDISTVALVSIIFLLIFLFVHPFERGFYCNDETIRYPYKSDTVPLWLAGVYGSFGALLIVILTEIYKKHGFCRVKKLVKTNFGLNTVNGILFYTLGAMATLLITEVGKRTIGRLRPHFIAVCQPKWEIIQCWSVIDGVKVAEYVKFNGTSSSTLDICANEDKRLIREARVSFPSGHSSFTVYSMLFIILYLEARLPNLKRTRFVKAGVQLIAFIAAWHTCMSRVSDHKHHYSDVIAGAALGFTVAIFTVIFINLYNLH